MSYDVSVMFILEKNNWKLMDFNASRITSGFDEITSTIHRSLWWFFCTIPIVNLPLSTCTARVENCIVTKGECIYGYICIFIHIHIHIHIHIYIYVYIIQPTTFRVASHMRTSVPKTFSHISILVIDRIYLCMLLCLFYLSALILFGSLKNI